MSIHITNLSPPKGSVLGPNAVFTFNYIGQVYPADLTRLEFKIEKRLSDGTTLTNIYVHNTYYQAILPPNYVKNYLTVLKDIVEDSTIMGYEILITPVMEFDTSQSINITITGQDTDGNTFSYPQNFQYNVINLERLEALIDLIQEIQEIDVEYEQGRIDVAQNKVSFGFNKSEPWSRLHDVNVYRNNIKLNSGYQVLYNGDILFSGLSPALDINDTINADYRFGYFTDEELIRAMKTALSDFNMSTPITNYSFNHSGKTFLEGVYIIGAACYLIRRILFSMTLQHKAIIFLDRYTEKIGILKDLLESYNKIFDQMKEAKKRMLPGINLTVTPEFTLPGGRSRFFRYLYKGGAS